MQRTLLKAKIHCAVVTHCKRHYENSCAIDEDLLEASGLVESEGISVWNVNNGARFTTCAIRAERGSGIISLNGSAAWRAQVGDLVVIAAYRWIGDRDVLDELTPKLVFVTEDNRIKMTRDQVPIKGSAKASRRESRN
jgi:aspartate 1-decarboxylase